MSDQEKCDRDYAEFKSYERDASVSVYQDGCWGGWDAYDDADDGCYYREEGWY